MGETCDGVSLGLCSSCLLECICAGGRNAGFCGNGIVDPLIDEECEVDAECINVKEYWTFNENAGTKAYSWKSGSYLDFGVAPWTASPEKSAIEMNAVQNKLPVNGGSVVGNEGTIELLIKPNAWGNKDVILRSYDSSTNTHFQMKQEANELVVYVLN